MKRASLVLILGFVALSVFGQATTVLRFTAPGSSSEPVFRISSLVVENSGLSLTTDVTEVLKKMDLFTLAPSTIEVPNGDLLLNWGGTEDFSRTFALHAGGSPLEVRLLGNRTAALWSLYASGFGALALLVSASPVAASSSLSLAYPIAAGAVTAAGLIGLAVFNPRIEIHQGSAP